MALAVGFAPRSFAQGAQGITPAGEYREGLPFGAWMVYPSIFFGATYNDNINQSLSKSIAPGDQSRSRLERASVSAYLRHQ